jgi:hypothetical protein
MPPVGRSDGVSDNGSLLVMSLLLLDIDDPNLERDVPRRTSQWVVGTEK